jgi:hypothetical protein
MARKKLTTGGIATVCQGEEAPPDAVESPAVQEPESQTPEAQEPIKHFRVFKKGNDSVSQFFGERVQCDPCGREYFNLTVAAKESVDGNSNLIWPIE